MSSRDLKNKGNLWVQRPYNEQDYVTTRDDSRIDVTWGQDRLPALDIGFKHDGVDSSVREAIGKFYNLEVELYKSEIEDTDVCACDCGLMLTTAAKLLQHQRMAHFHVPGLNCKLVCPECAMAKAKKIGHASERPAELTPKRFAEQVAFDFKGKYLPSFPNRNEWVLNAIDECTGWTEAYPVRSKADCA